MYMLFIDGRIKEYRLNILSFYFIRIFWMMVWIYFHIKIMFVVFLFSFLFKDIFISWHKRHFISVCKFKMSI